MKIEKHSPVSISQKIIILVCATMLVLPSLSASAATKRVYEYNVNGRLITMYTATQKTTYSYDKNGNLFRKQIEKGDYSSIITAANTK
ncbi:RHS repeat domain-containing protein [Paenibacillus kandeliae]|uniref:RHS repeat domain-containing protein n=1 Tax=Paenibacillus kandeliae TaxID=3231269 RepID=UPI00345ACDE0